MKQVLVVDDDVSIGLLAQSMLEKIGCRGSRAVGSELEALDALQRNHFHAAIIDTRLTPECDIVRLVAHLDQHGIAVIVALGSRLAELPGELQLRPYVTKPYSAADVRRALQYFWPDLYR